MDLSNVDDATLMIHVAMLLDDLSAWAQESRDSEASLLCQKTADMLRTVTAKHLLAQRRTEVVL